MDRRLGVPQVKVSSKLDGPGPKWTVQEYSTARKSVVHPDVTSLERG